MSFQTSSHFDSTSLLIVKNEIENTIKNVETAVNNLLEDNALPFGIDDSLHNLEQCVQVLHLINRPYIARLTELTTKVMQKIINDFNHQGIRTSDVHAMSEATNIIKRYIDFLCVRETHAPQFLVPTLNKLEIALGINVTTEGSFVAPFLETIKPNITLETPSALPPSQYVIRLYKLSLLNFLREKETDLDFQALSLCGNYLSAQATGTPSEQYWRLVHLALKDFDNTIITEPRLRILIQIENLSQQFLQRPQLFSVSQMHHADIIALCLSQDSEVSYQIREQLNINDDLLSDNQLQVLSRQLFGPDLETIRTVVQLLIEQIKEVSIKIEFGQYIQNTDEREQVYNRLNEICNILDLINLNDASLQLRAQAQQILANQSLSSEKHANAIINTLLFATNSLQILERNYTPSRLKLKFNNTQITLDKVEEAQKVLCTEARVTLKKVFDSVEQFSQSSQLSVLEDAPELLKEVSGALLFLESKQGYQVLQKSAKYIEKMINTNQNISANQLQLLASGIVSADFYLEQLQNGLPIMSKPMSIAEQSIEELSQAVA